MSDSDYSESTSDGSATYAQIVVPDYTLENPVASSSDNPVTTGSSFLRLGSFPSLTGGDDPRGFSNSLALAQLVGGTATSYPTTSDALAANLSEGEDEAPESLQKSSGYEGDANYLLGFVDDTRYHGKDPGTTFIDWVEMSNTVENRQAETNRLLFKGGWWDHSDGNRITTTSGDKVEVIQGNYKLVVLGRQDPTQTDLSTLASGAVVNDLSGGQEQIQDGGPTPNVLSIEWVESDGAWTLYQDNCVNGNVTTRTYGQQAQYFKGTRITNQIGSNPHEITGAIHDVNQKTDPTIISNTWAERIETYVGANGKPVPVMMTWTHALAINNIVTAIELTTTSFATIWELTVGSKVSVLIGPTAEVVVGPKLDVGLVKYQYLNGKNVFALESNEASLLRAELNTIHKSISAVSTKLINQDTKIANTKQELQNSITSVSTSVTEVATSVTELATTVDRVGFEMSFIALSHFIG